MKKTLVLGASYNPARYSNLIINKLVAHGHEVHAIGLKEAIVAGVDVITHKEMIPDIDTVSLYLNAQRQKEYYDYIIAMKPQRVIFNPGTENPELYDLLKEHSIYFEIACNLVLLSTDQY